MPIKFFTIARLGAVSMTRFLWKHKYFIIVLLVLLPAIITSINTAIKTKNPSYPFVLLGLRLSNADADINKDVNILRKNPEELVGMAKPSEGIWALTKYYWKFFFNVIWKMLGNIFLISVPFVFFYNIFKWQGSKGQTSSESHNVSLALTTGLIFIFIINIFILAHGLFKGNTIITMPEGTLTNFQEIWYMIVQTLPFHGLFNLGKYLIGII